MEGGLFFSYLRWRKDRWRRGVYAIANAGREWTLYEEP